MNETRSVTGRPSRLATASAILSCIGLGVGHLLGLALAVASVRRMDRSKGALYGYRLALTGCIVGLIGLFWLPFGLPPLLRASPGGGGRQYLLVALVCQVELPLFMLLFGLQDLLPPPRCEHGYGFLGPHLKRIPMDIAMATVGSLLGAALAAASVVLRWPEQLTIVAFGGGGLLVVISLGALLGRRACRVLWAFLVIALALGAAVCLNAP